MLGDHNVFVIGSLRFLNLVLRTRKQLAIYLSLCAATRIPLCVRLWWGCFQAGFVYVYVHPQLLYCSCCSFVFVGEEETGV